MSDATEPMLKVFDKDVTNKFTEYKDSDTSEEARADVQKFVDFLKFPRNTNPTFFGDYLDAMLKMCNVPINIFTTSCEFSEDFMRELGLEKKMTVTACKTNVVAELDIAGQELEKPSQCVMVKMETLNSTYMINFNYTVSKDNPAIEYIRRIPNE
ncbi:hypothetical protein D3C87_1627070 [compost metagenome]